MSKAEVLNAETIVGVYHALLASTRRVDQWTKALEGGVASEDVTAIRDVIADVTRVVGKRAIETQRVQIRAIEKAMGRLTNEMWRVRKATARSLVEFCRSECNNCHMERKGKCGKCTVNVELWENGPLEGLTEETIRSACCGLAKRHAFQLGNLEERFYLGCESQKSELVEACRRLVDAITDGLKVEKQARFKRDRAGSFKVRYAFHGCIELISRFH